MRYQVPQFVDIEDKVIGPLTVKQFLIYVVAAMLLAPVYVSSDLALFLTIALPVAAIAAAFAHIRPGGKSLMANVSNAASYLARGRIFIWRRTSQPKLLPVQGDEYRHQDLSGILPAALQTSALADQARTLNTSGSVINEDLEDPYENAK
jgi:hypothetical protein